MSHNHQKKIAVINDLSGFGRCSIAVALPLISHLGVQCCPLPTAIFSNHTGFPSFYFDDYTDSMAPYMTEWEKLGLEFEGILTGFLGSSQQISLAVSSTHLDVYKRQVQSPAPPAAARCPGHCSCRACSHRR